MQKLEVEDECGEDVEVGIPAVQVQERLKREKFLLILNEVWEAIDLDELYIL